MEELFENKTKYLQEEYETFLKVHQKEYAASEYAYILFNLIFFGCCAAIAFKEKEIILGIVLVVGLLIYIWYKFFRPARRMQEDLESEKLSGNFVNTYKFYKKYFKVENTEGNAQLAYIGLYRVVETNENYYIYISRDNAFIVSKKGFTKGNEKEFSKFIRGKVFMKYKNRMKRGQAK